MKINLSNRS